jgi:hypothetical protein
MPSAAGRLVDYSRDGENIFWENPDAQGRPRPGGGHQLDLGPEARIIPSHPVAWTGKYTWAKLGNDAFLAASEPDPVLGMRIEKTFRMEGRSGALEISSRMWNVSGQPQSYCTWDRTLCKAGGFAFFRLGSKSRFPARWVIGKRKGGAWEYNGVDPHHDNIDVRGDVLVATASGPEQKIGADTDGGYIAYVRDRLLFVKYFPYFPDGRYTDGGLAVAFYFNDALAELEPISPEATLKPGEDYIFREKWTLTRLDHSVRTPAEVRELADSILPSPFRR